MFNVWGNKIKNQINDKALLQTEKHTLKWFLALFYVIYFFYEIYYQFFYLDYLQYGNAEGPVLWNYIFYVLIFSLLPLTYFMLKKGKLFQVKYYFVLCYFLISIFSESVPFLYSSESLRIGNAAELLLLLFSPIFVNTHFFWFVCIGLILKYLMMGLFLGTTEVIFPAMLVIILAFIASIILKRFQVYVGAIKTSYDNQLEGIVKGVIATIELKDQYTRGHSERVAFYAKTLAIALNKYSKAEIQSFYYACLLHDIGKVSIPDEILMKRGKLTNEEYEIIKTHPVVGTEAIRKVDGLYMSIDVIKYHHERWDGTGYPDQLAGTDIPLLARVVSIADAFDAMTSSRSYRSAMSVDEAYRRIIDGKGTQFDPKLVEVFETTFPEWVNYHKSYDWSEAVPLQNSNNKEEIG
ncbi:HD-GYP domain-containing protein [Mesobacillus maritimus]|uniref:HD-GYP domain-containing protein n=1 Tax=Mesobacillus maritimus TaxID=1643336 RepID=A0ABS7K7L5_9BACI|nr:HD-GYP domain-containing protein [Mesobacillus maritimus]MBY0098269.1 HD-GYP domain-containing protein [Mesobacillus maritimus]